MYKRFQGQESWKSTCNRWNLIRNVTKANAFNAFTLDLIRVPASNTLDNVRAWATSFDKLMQSDIGRQIFTKFLESEYSDENMLFWNACADLKKERSMTKCVNMMKDIFEMFVAPCAPLEVNLDSKTKQELRKRMIDHPDKKSFEPAQDAIYLLMKRDCFGRFIKSKIYQDFVKQVELASNSAHGV